MSIQKSGSGVLVPLGEVCGYAPGGVPAYSNGNDELFTAKANYDDHFFTGYQWQCVEFARRWLLERKGLVLPEYYIAAHIIYGTCVYTLEGTPFPCQVTRNGSVLPPQADTLIIYPSSKKNVVGHIGVITEVGDGWIRVADQNRFFHNWEGASYSAQFTVEQDPTTRLYHIVDPDVTPSGWIAFAGAVDRPANVKLVIPKAMSKPPKAWFWTHLGFVFRSVQEHWRSKHKCCSRTSDNTEAVPEEGCDVVAAL